MTERDAHPDAAERRHRAEVAMGESLARLCLGREQALASSERALRGYESAIDRAALCMYKV
jgi:hypothetical protein